MPPTKEVFISVDIEASGPIPGEYSLLSIGACMVDNPDESFYAELKPVVAGIPISHHKPVQVLYFSLQEQLR